MEFLTVKSIVVEQGGDRRGLQALGLHPEDVVTVLQVKVPTALLADQLVQHGSQLSDLGMGEDRGFEHQNRTHPQKRFSAHKRKVVQCPRL